MQHSRASDHFPACRAPVICTGFHPPPPPRRHCLGSIETVKPEFVIRPSVTQKLPGFAERIQ
jgi:hypothetical protein